MKKIIYLSCSRFEYSELSYLKSEFEKREIYVGDRATIGDRAKIGDGATIGNMATVGDGARIGNMATVGDGARIGDNATIGDGATIGYHATIGDSATIGNMATVGLLTKISNNSEVLLQIVLYNSYKYTSSAYIDSKTGDKWIQLGCHLRKLSDWDSDFWNNDYEFPNNNSIESNKRLTTFNKLKLILDM